MRNTKNWVLSGSSAILAAGALVIVGRAGEGLAFYGGLVMFVVCVLFIMRVLTAGDTDD